MHRNARTNTLNVIQSYKVLYALCVLYCVLFPCISVSFCLCTHFSFICLPTHFILFAHIVYFAFPHISISFCLPTYFILSMFQFHFVFPVIISFCLSTHFSFILCLLEICITMIIPFTSIMPSWLQSNYLILCIVLYWSLQHLYLLLYYSCQFSFGFFPPCRIYFCMGFPLVSTDLNQLLHVIVIGPQLYSVVKFLFFY